MKQWIVILGALLSPLVICPCSGLAETLEVRLRIRNDTSDKDIVKKENLVSIKNFILQQGKRETYCNMYSNNPAYHTTKFDFYLNPDTGQQNINCDPSKSDFNNLTIRSVAKGRNARNQYRTVEFADQHAIYITANWPTDDLTVSQVRQLVEDALNEILTELAQKKPNDTPEGVTAAETLEKFKATDFSSFFRTDKATFRKDTLGGVIFKMRPRYVAGGTLQTICRGVGIAIYESHEAALAAVEWRRKDVAAVIEKGQKERNGISHWWFSESQALLSVVKGSMVFEVSVLDKRYSTVEDELWATAMQFLKTAEPNASANWATPRR